MTETTYRKKNLFDLQFQRGKRSTYWGGMAAETAGTENWVLTFPATLRKHRDCRLEVGQDYELSKPTPSPLLSHKATPHKGSMILLKQHHQFSGQILETVEDSSHSNNHILFPSFIGSWCIIMQDAFSSTLKVLMLSNILTVAKSLFWDSRQPFN